MWQMNEQDVFQGKFYHNGNDIRWWDMERKYKCSPPAEPKCNVHWVSNWTVELSILQKTLGFEFMRFWIYPFVVWHRPMEQSLRKKKYLVVRWPLPLVGDHDRVGRNMIVVVEIIAGWLMRNALTRQECQLATMLEMNKGIPRGVTGFHLGFRHS